MDSTLLSSFRQLSLSPDHYRDGESSRTSRSDYLVDVENDDRYHIPPLNIEAFSSEPRLMAFLSELFLGNGGSVDRFSRMFHFDGTGSYLESQHSTHVQPNSQNIANIFEVLKGWLTEKLFRNPDFMPILEKGSLQNATDGIMFRLREDSYVFEGLSNVLISFRAGHIYSFHIDGDKIVMPQSYESFANMYPLFVNVSIIVGKSEVRHNSHNTCKVLVVTERVAPFEMSEMSARSEEVVTSMNVTGNGAN